MFMLHLGEILEEWTHKKSVADLASAMSLRVDSVWLQANGAEVLTKITDVKPGDRIVIRTGGMIPLDGRVVEGEAMVNQSSLTGEAKGPSSFTLTLPKVVHPVRLCLNSNERFTSISP